MKNKNQTALKELIQDYGLKLAQQALWSAERVTLISLAALAHCSAEPAIETINGAHDNDLVATGTDGRYTATCTKCNAEFLWCTKAAAVAIIQGGCADCR